MSGLCLSFASIGLFCSVSMGVRNFNSPLPIQHFFYWSAFVYIAQRFNVLGPILLFRSGCCVHCVLYPEYLKSVILSWFSLNINCLRFRATILFSSLPRPQLTYSWSSSDIITVSFFSFKHGY